MVENEKKWRVQDEHHYRVEFQHIVSSDDEHRYIREFYCDGKLEYSDSLTEVQYIHSLDYPDLFRMLEMFSMGFIPLNSMVMEGDICLWNMQGQDLNNRPRGNEVSDLLRRLREKATKK